MTALQLHWGERLDLISTDSIDAVWPRLAVPREWTAYPVVSEVLPRDWGSVRVSTSVRTARPLTRTFDGLLLRHGTGCRLVGRIGISARSRPALVAQAFAGVMGTVVPSGLGAGDLVQLAPSVLYAAAAARALGSAREDRGVLTGWLAWQLGTPLAAASMQR